MLQLRLLTVVVLHLLLSLEHQTPGVLVIGLRVDHQDLIRERFAFLRDQAPLVDLVVRQHIADRGRNNELGRFSLENIEVQSHSRFVGFLQG